MTTETKTENVILGFTPEASARLREICAKHRCDHRAVLAHRPPPGTPITIEVRIARPNGDVGCWQSATHHMTYVDRGCLVADVRVVELR